MRKTGGLRTQQKSSSFKRLPALAIIVWLAFLAFSIAETLSSSSGITSSNIVEVDDPRSLPDKIPGKGAAVLYFKQEFCPGRAKVEPALLKYISESPEIKLVVAHIDKTLNRDAKATLEMLGNSKVLGTPTLIAYLDGREVGRHVSTFGLGEQYTPLKSL